MSCIALTLFYDYAESRGHTRDALQADLPYPPAYLDDRSNWVDYETFLEMERRMAVLFPDDPDLYFNIGCTISSSNRALAFTRVMVRSVISPFSVYGLVPRIVPRFLFPRLNIEFTRTGRRTLRGRYTFDEGYPPSAGWIGISPGEKSSSRSEYESGRSSVGRNFPSKDAPSSRRSCSPRTS